MFRSRSAFTIVELAMATAITALVSSIVYSVWIGASVSTRVTGSHLEAVQSVMIASHALRSDLDVMYYTNLFQDGKPRGGNIHIDGDETRLTFHIPRNLDSMSWRVDLVPVSYYLEPAESIGTSFRLVRELPGETRALGGCYLGGIHFKIVPPRALVPHRMFLQVTLEGLDQPTPRSRFPASLLLPVHRKLPPAAYPLDPEGVRAPFPEGPP